MSLKYLPFGMGRTNTHVRFATWLATFMSVENKWSQQWYSIPCLTPGWFISDLLPKLGSIKGLGINLWFPDLMRQGIPCGKRANGKCLVNGGFLEVSLPLLMKGGRFGYGSKPCTPVVHIKIAGKWMFIPLKMVSIGIEPYPFQFSLRLQNLMGRRYQPVQLGGPNLWRIRLWPIPFSWPYVWWPTPEFWWVKHRFFLAQSTFFQVRWSCLNHLESTFSCFIAWFFFVSVTIFTSLVRLLFSNSPAALPATPGAVDLSQKRVVSWRHGDTSWVSIMGLLAGKHTKSYWEWPFIVDLPINNSCFP